MDFVRRDLTNTDCDGSEPLQRSAQLPARLSMLDEYPLGFEEDDWLRSQFIRRLTLRQLRLGRELPTTRGQTGQASLIPRTLVRFWHDQLDVPADVRRCLDSWDPLLDEGFAFRMFCDVSAAAYIAERYGPKELAAFERCRHPAMRSDYLRMCFVLADGGLYVDADDVLLGVGWKDIFFDDKLKVQPLCYDLNARSMVPASELRRTDMSTVGRIFYINNNPIASAPGHPVLRRALTRATDRLLGGEPTPEIQSTTGPGNLTAALAAHARESPTPDFDLMLDWEKTAQPCWDLDYRNDARNWRHMAAGEGPESQ